MKYRVQIPFIVFVTTEVEADSDDSAIDIAVNEVELNKYRGNGFDGNLVGSYNPRDDIEPGDFFDSVNYLPIVEIINS